MAVKQTGQLSLADAIVAGGGGATLDRIDALVDWATLEKPLVGRETAGRGRAAWPTRVLLKAVLLQSLYGLSDRGLEEALSDRLSFRRFCGLGLQEGVPDHSVITKFRGWLVAEGLAEALFVGLTSQLDQAGLILKAGTMLDATLVPAGHRPGSDRSTPVDGDAAFGGPRRKGRQTYGYKAHVGVDKGSGLVRRVLTTPANVPDTVPADALISGDEGAVWADAAYHTRARETALRARGIKPRLARRPNKHHPDLPPRLARLNRMIAHHRAGVETTFATWKRRMGLTDIRYRGLAKAQGQMVLVALAFNLRRWAALTG